MPRSCLAKADYVCCKRGSWRPLAKDNSYGLTTLKTRHVTVDGNEVRFRFTGKSGKQWSLRVKDRRIAKIIKACQELPGQELLTTSSTASTSVPSTSKMTAETFGQRP
jgi:DNA topoisomerase IB